MNRAAKGCLTWLAFVVLGALIAVILSACSTQPDVDPYAPWYNIPKPMNCGPGCEQWREPGMMVRLRSGEKGWAQ